MAATAQLRAKLTLDNSQYMRAMKASSAAATEFGTGAAKIAAAGLVVLTAALAGVAVALADGVLKAYELGDSLDELSMKTGIAVDQLLILKRAAKDNGIENVVGAVKKMQVNLVDAVKNGAGPAAKALAQLGLTGMQLIDQLPTDQLALIGQRINAIENPALKTAEAVAIFGREGAQMLALFKDSDALGKAAASIGRQAQILKESAAAFGHVNDTLRGAGDKIMGFFVGVAETILPAMTALVNTLDSIDLADEGEKFGKGIETAVEFFTGAFTHPQDFLNIMVNYLKAGLLEAAELWAKRMILNATDFAANFVHYVTQATNVIAAGLEYAFQEALSFFAGGWRDMIPTLAIAFTNIVSEALKIFTEGVKAVANLDFSFDVGKAIGDAAIAVGKAAASIGGPKKSFGDMLKQVSAANPMTQWETTIRKSGEALAGNIDFGSHRFLDAANKGAAALQKAGQAVVYAAAGMQTPGARLEDFQGAAYSQFRGFGSGNPNGGLRTGGLSTGGLATGRFAAGAAYGQTPLLNHREMARFQNSAVASGTLDPDARRSNTSAYHVTRSGDHRRQRNVAIEKQREDQKNIATNIATTAINTGRTAVALETKN